MSYTVTSSISADITNRFADHVFINDQATRSSSIETGAQTLATLIASNVPPSPEYDKAIQFLQLSIFWARSAMLLNETAPVVVPITPPTTPPVTTTHNNYSAP